MILSFADRRTAALFKGLVPKGVPADVASVAKRKLDQIDAAATLQFLRAPPGNRLEALKGSRKGQHSVRVNDQWRICFRWSGQHAEDVEFCDYHGGR
ncbi:type II toxin-antitoxin system RelE/ParE family toxin [Rhodocista pekingensis]|uniref:Type II toxin-antitoxin system RelE/ParE family toxin n=1 Tax=Rhodocista pekingensis TaxID=201185 RepID=A0ABW2KS37_9PROT